MKRARVAALLLLPFAAATACGGGKGAAPGFDPPNGGPVDSVLFVMGDGMGPEHVRSGGIYKHGAPGTLRFEEADFERTVMSTWSDSTILTDPDKTATDSAAAATAMATGRKAPNLHLSRLDGGEKLLTILELAQSLGKSTGIVTNSYVHDASPAAFAAHARSRSNTEKIVCDYLEGTRPNVILGGGKLDWDRVAGPLRAARAGYTVAEDVDQFRALIDSGGLDRIVAAETGQGGRGLFGVFEGDTRVYPERAVFDCPTLVADQVGKGLSLQLDRELNAADPSRRFPDPSLPELADAALDLVMRNPDGFFLFVEDEQTDTMNHYFGLADPDACADEDGPRRVPLVQEFVAREVGVIDEIVAAAVARLEAAGRLDRTLIVVTADHECCGLAPVQCEDRFGDPVACCEDAAGGGVPCCRDADGALAPCKPWHRLNPEAETRDRTLCRRYAPDPDPTKPGKVENVVCSRPGDVLRAGTRYPRSANLLRDSHPVEHTGDAVQVFAKAPAGLSEHLQDVRTNTDLYYLMQFALTGSYRHVTPPEDYRDGGSGPCDDLPDDPPGL